MALYPLKKQYSVDFSNPRKKPVGDVEIDWSNPLSNGLLYFFVWQDDKPYDLVTKRFVGLTTASIDRKFNSDNAYIDHSGRAQASTDYSPFSDIGSNAFSLLVKFRQPETSNQGLICSRVGNGDNQIELRTNSPTSGDIEFILRDGVSNESLIATSVVNGDWQTVIGTNKDGAQAIYVDGVSSASESGSAITFGGSPIFVFGGLPNTTVIEYLSDRSIDVAWKRALSNADALSLSKNPYQILKPKTPPVYFTPSGVIGSTLTADSGSYSYTGTNAELIRAKILIAASGSYTYTGTSANLLKGHLLNANSGSYAYTGTAAALTYTPAGAFVLTADSGAYNYTGQDINFNRNRVIIASSGNYTYNGTDIQIILPGQIWTDKPSVSTNWTNQTKVTTIWTDK